LGLVLTTKTIRWTFSRLAWGRIKICKPKRISTEKEKLKHVGCEQGERRVNILDPKQVLKKGRKKKVYAKIVKCLMACNKGST